MAPYQERVIQEKKELDEKLGKLELFFSGPEHAGLPPMEQGRLARQHSAMEDYSNILGERIEGRVEKTLHNSDVSGARQNVPDIEIVGDGDMFRLLCKASSQREGWMKSTKAMEVPGGCVVQVTTQQRAPDGSYAVAEALTFVPGVQIAHSVNGGRQLVMLQQAPEIGA